VRERERKGEIERERAVNSDPAAAKLRSNVCAKLFVWKEEEGSESEGPQK